MSSKITMLPNGKFITEEGFFMTGCREAAIVVQMICLLLPHARRKGKLTTGRIGFEMMNGKIHHPDVSFTRNARLPDGEAPSGYGRFAPDLCVEVISPSEEPREMRENVEEYFASGAELVWHVFPETQRVIVFTSPVQTKTLEASEVLDGGSVIPGFSHNVSELFDVD